MGLAFLFKLFSINRSSLTGLSKFKLRRSELFVEMSFLHYLSSVGATCIIGYYVKFYKLI